MTIWIGLIALGLGVGTSLFLPVPQTLKTNFDAGQSLYALGEYEGAILEYSKIVKFDSPAVRTDSVRVTFGDDLELPVMAAAWYQLGNARMRSGQHEEAVGAFREVIAMEEVDEDFRSLVQFRVAETRFLQKEFDKAAEEYKRYADLFPSSDLAGEAYFYSGWSLFNLERYDDAITALRGMLESYPEDRYASDSQFRIASSYYEKEEYERAVDEAEVVLELYPTSPVIAQATYLKAQAFDQMGRSEEAIAGYREVRDLYDRMYELLRGSFREGKNVDFDNYRQLFETSSLRVAEIYRRGGAFEEAYEELITAQETAEERFYKAKVQMRLGDNFMEWGQRSEEPAGKQERFEEAYTTYNQVIELYGDTPYPPIAQYNKGEARYFAGDFEEARQEYSAVATLYPDSDTGLRANALYSAGWSSEKLEDFETALDVYGQVVESFPRSDQAPLCLLRIGRVNTEQQRFDEAIEAYRIIADNYGETRHAADANYGLGLLYKQRGELDGAIDAFSRVGREAGEVYVASLIEAANIHIGAGRSEEGRQVLDQLLKGGTGDRALEAQAHYQIAQLDLNNDNYVDAINRYTKVIDEYPEAKVIREVRYGRALAYHKANRFSRALADYQWLLDQDLPESMQLKVNFAMALSFAAQGQDAEATKLLTQVIESGDETLARNAQLQLISMAEKQDPEDAIRTLRGHAHPPDHSGGQGAGADPHGQRLLPSRALRAERRRLSAASRSGRRRGGHRQRPLRAGQQPLPRRRAGRRRCRPTRPSSTTTRRSAGRGTRSSRSEPPTTRCRGTATVQYLPYVAEAFRTYYTAYPDDEKAVYAYYYAAFAEYRMGKWRESSETFQDLASKFPRSDFAAQSLFRAGEAVFNLAQGETREKQEGDLQGGHAQVRRRPWAVIRGRTWSTTPSTTRRGPSSTSPTWGRSTPRPTPFPSSSGSSPSTPTVISAPPASSPWATTTTARRSTISPRRVTGSSWRCSPSSV